jgi:hypothetical protein
VNRALSVRMGALATAIVATGSAVLSWDALSWGAGQLGVDGHLTWLYPVVIDGTIGVGTVCALALRGSRFRIRLYVWAVTSGAIGASVVGNGAHAAGGSAIHVVGAAVPAVALAVALHLLVILVRHAPRAAVEPGDQVADVIPAPAAAPELANGTPERALVEPVATAPTLSEPEPERAGTGSAPSGRAKTARTPRPQRAVAAPSTPPRRLPAGARHEQVRALLAKPGGRALTGEEIADSLGIDAGYARRLRAEVTGGESAPPLALVGAVADDEGAHRLRRETTDTAAGPMPSAQQEA